MKCIKCTEQNINKANFCKKCGYEFSEAEQKIAKKKTLVGKIEQLEKAYSVCKLKVITDHIIFKIISLTIVIILGIQFALQNGRDVRIVESDKYNIEYNTITQEYYLLVNEDTVNLNLFIPNDNQKLIIHHLDQNHNTIDQKDYKNEKDIILNSNTSEDYYILESDKKSIKFYIYRTEV